MMTMMMMVMRRIMTWIIIVNESRKRSKKIEYVWENKRNLLSQSVQKASREVENQALHF